MTRAELAKKFGVSASNMQSKAKIIRETFGLVPFDPDWTLRSLMHDNPLIWLLEVDGVLMDIRTAPRELQQAAYEQGLIPYIPADRV